MSNGTSSARLEEIDGFYVAYVAYDVDRALREEVVDEENIFRDVIDAEVAAFGYVFDVPGGEALQAVYVAVVWGNEDRAVC